MEKEWELTQTEFDRLLLWLDPDREQAGRKYESIRLRLIKVFTGRGCLEAEFLADQTINRVTPKVKEISKSYVGDPALYFYAVAQIIHLEYQKKARRSPMTVKSAASTPTVGETEDVESVYQCLEHCLEHLTSNSRELLVRYYQQEKQARIDQRKLLAAELGIAMNALRIRAHRIRLALRQCVRHCLEQQAN